MNKKNLARAEQSLQFELRYGDGLAWIGKGIYFLSVFLALKFSLIFLLLLPPLLYPLYRFIHKEYVLPRRGIARTRINLRPKRLIFGTVIGGSIAMILVLYGMWVFANDVSELGLIIWFGLAIAFIAGNWLHKTIINWDGKHPYPWLDGILLLILIGALLVFGINALNLATACLVYGLFNLVTGVWQFRSFCQNNPVIADE